MYLQGLSECRRRQSFFFGFPKDPNLRKSWIHAIRRDPGKDFQPTGRTKVCSRHFKTTDMKTTLAGIVKLKPGSIPSKFAWSSQSPKKRKSLSKRREPSIRLKASRDVVPREASTSEFVLEFLELTIEELLAESRRDNTKLKEEVSKLQIQLNELQIAKQQQEKANRHLMAELWSERREALETLFNHGALLKAGIFCKLDDQPSAGNLTAA